MLVRQDLRDISRLVELDKIETLLLILPPRIMAPLSMANLAGELEVAHTTVKSWLEHLKRLYLIFAVPPWSRKIPRGIRKEKKWFPDAPTIGIQVVNQRGVLQKYPDRTWVMSCEKLLSLLGHECHTFRQTKICCLN